MHAIITICMTCHTYIDQVIEEGEGMSIDTSHGYCKSCYHKVMEELESLELV